MACRYMSQPDRTLFWLAAASFASMASMRICDPMLPALAAEQPASAAVAAAQGASAAGKAAGPGANHTASASGAAPPTS